MGKTKEHYFHFAGLEDNPLQLPVMSFSTIRSLNLMRHTIRTQARPRSVSIRDLDVCN